VSLYRDKAVVLRTYDLREADRIIVMMTENYGKVRAVAKGVRKTKSKFGARLEPLSHIDVLLSTTGRDLDIVSQVDLVSSVDSPCVFVSHHIDHANRIIFRPMAFANPSTKEAINFDPKQLGAQIS